MKLFSLAVRKPSDICPFQSAPPALTSSPVHSQMPSRPLGTGSETSKPNLAKGQNVGKDLKEWTKRPKAGHFWFAAPCQMPLSLPGLKMYQSTSGISRKEIATSMSSGIQ